MQDDTNPIIVEQIFNSTVEKIWSAITELEQMQQWFFENIKSFKPLVGFKTQFVVQNENRIFTHQWEITEVTALKKISYSWNYKEYPGNSLVTFELTDLKDSVKLKLTHLVVDSFHPDIPEFERESGVAGWNYFITKRLKGFLNDA